jgi:hypothetical protein
MAENLRDAALLPRAPAPIRGLSPNSWGEDARLAIHSEVRAKGLLVRL